MADQPIDTYELVGLVNQSFGSVLRPPMLDLGCTDGARC
jgi:hypothetical protein